MSNTELHPSSPKIHLTDIKQILRDRLAAEWNQIVPAVLIHRAIEEADLLARSTDFPALFLPELASEQVRRVSIFTREPEPVAKRTWFETAA